MCVSSYKKNYRETKTISMYTYGLINGHNRTENALAASKLLSISRVALRDGT